MEEIWRVLTESHPPTIGSVALNCTTDKKVKSYLICPDRRLVGYYRDMRKRWWQMVGVYIFEPGTKIIKILEV